MKRKIIVLLLACSLSASLVACNNTNPSKENESQENISDESKDDAKNPDSTNDSDTTEEEGMKKTPIITNKDLNLSGTSGPFQYTLDEIQVSKLIATTDEMAEILDIEKNKEVALVVINASAENTSEDTLSFYLGEAILTTNTKEQVDSDSVLSEYIDSEFLGKVKNSGNLVFILKNSKAEDLTELKLHVDAPSNEDFETVGDEVKIDISLK